MRLIPEFDTAQGHLDKWPDCDQCSKTILAQMVRRGLDDAERILATTDWIGNEGLRAEFEAEAEEGRALLRRLLPPA